MKNLSAAKCRAVRRVVVPACRPGRPGRNSDRTGQELLPIRYGRMRTDPFASLRGAAAVMAADLTRTPATGIRVQACGDAHLANFGSYATP